MTTTSLGRLFMVWTTDDCIIRCNAAGTAWQLVVDCGWAQNFPYSSSCLDSQPHPVCQDN